MALATGYKMKPPVSARVTPGHPLARNLVGCWLMNEGGGTKLFDSSGYKNTGTFVNTPDWQAGYINLNGTDERITVPDQPIFTPNKGLTVLVKFISDGQPAVDNEGLVSHYLGAGTQRSWGIDIRTSSYVLGSDLSSNGSYQAANGLNGSTILNAGQKYIAALVWNPGTYGKLYLDGKEDATNSTTPSSLHNSTNPVWIGCEYSTAAHVHFDGRIGFVMIWGRALTASEIALLYRQPFCMFEQPAGPSLMFAPAAQVVSLAGTSSAVSSVDGSLSVTAEVTLAGTVDAVTSFSGSLSVTGQVALVGTVDTVAALYGSLSVTGQVTLAGTVEAVTTLYGSVSVTGQVTLAGTVEAVATLYGLLSVAGEVTLAGPVDTAAALCGILTLYRPGLWFSGLLQIEKKWLIGALFGGVTANAFKLGTVLSLGWFWMRRSGCSALYRGPSMPQIDFANVLAVAAQDAGSILPPVYIPHDGGSTYFYVIRRFNNCGYQEHTLAAAVKIVLDAQGDIAEPTPNSIFASRAEQIDANRVRLVWYYCPLGQKSAPACFNVHCDSGTGQIDYENPIATVGYEGRKFYDCESSALGAGRYLFAIRAEDAAGIQNNSFAQMGIQLGTTSPDAISILSAEGV